MKNNKIAILSKAFAVRIVRLYQYMVETKKEFVISKQLLRSGTSIGANVRESLNAASRADFINKLNIALKEADETQYWLDVLRETDCLSEKEYNSIATDCRNIVGTLVNILKSCKKT